MDLPEEEEGEKKVSDVSDEQPHHQNHQPPSLHTVRKSKATSFSHASICISPTIAGGANTCDQTKELGVAKLVQDNVTADV